MISLSASPLIHFTIYFIVDILILNLTFLEIKFYLFFINICFVLSVTFYFGSFCKFILNLGVEFGARMINIDSKQIKLQIWDTAGKFLQK